MSLKHKLAVGLTVVLAVFIAALAVMKVVYGGGQPFPDRSTPAVVNTEDVQAISLDLPPGCVTVASDGRVFFDTHPFAAARRFGVPVLYEVVDGEPVPWPSVEAQDQLVAPFGVHADRQGRLWITEPATLDRPATRILAFDIASGELVVEHVLPDGVGRFAQDLRISHDGKKVVLADTGAFKFTPGGLLVVDVETGTVDRVFEHESLNPEDWFIERFDGAPHRVLWGLVSFQVGVDGVSFTTDGEWLVYGTMSHSALYKVPTDLFLDASVDDATLAAAIERVGDKPQNDGIAISPDDRVLLTDIEHGGIAEMTLSGELRTLTNAKEVVWADSVEVAPDGTVWFTDSAIPAYFRQDLEPPTREALAASAPYKLYRFALPQPVH